MIQFIRALLIRVLQFKEKIWSGLFIKLPGLFTKGHQYLKRKYGGLYYGNTLDYEVNRTARKIYQNSKKMSKIKPNLDSKFLSKNGYIDFGYSNVDQVLMKQIKNEFESAIIDPKYSIYPFDDEKIRAAYNHGGYEGSVREYRRDIIDCSTAIPTITKLIHSIDFIKLIENTIGCKFEYDGIYGWRICHTPDEILQKFEVITNRFHFDGQFPYRFKIFIYLNDVTEKNGPFQHFSKFYSKFLLWKGFKEEFRTKAMTGNLPANIANSKHLIKHVGSLGSMVLCATSFCLHRAGEPAFDYYRDILQICVIPKKFNIGGQCG